MEQSIWDIWPPSKRCQSVLGSNCCVSSLHCSAIRKLRSLEWRSSLSQETRAKMPWSPTWRWIFLLYWLLYINDILYKCNSISFMIMRMAFICLCVEGNTSLWFSWYQRSLMATTYIWYIYWTQRVSWWFSWNQRSLTATGLPLVSTLTSQRHWTQNTRFFFFFFISKHSTIVLNEWFSFLNLQSPLIAQHNLGGRDPHVGGGDEGG